MSAIAKRKDSLAGSDIYSIAGALKCRGVRGDSTV